MNYYGSYRHLLGNSEAAMMAAIEIYNKPTFEYRDECVAILLINAWELLLKAMLSKNRQSIYRPKKRNQPYFTLSWSEALSKAEPFFPGAIALSPVATNVRFVARYRDESVHFYSVAGLGVLFYALTQTCIMNYRDVLEAAFGRRLEDRIVWALLPVGVRPPIDAVSYMSESPEVQKPGPVREFIRELSQASNEVAAAGGDTGRVLTVFRVHLESVKKAGDADISVGINSEMGAEGTSVVYRTRDPNDTWPLYTQDVVDRVGSVRGQPFTRHVFYAVAWRYGLRGNRQYCWKARDGRLTSYSHDVVAFIKRLTPSELETAVAEYRNHLSERLQTGAAHT